MRPPRSSAKDVTVLSVRPAALEADARVVAERPGGRVPACARRRCGCPPTARRRGPGRATSRCRRRGSSGPSGRAGSAGSVDCCRSSRSSPRVGADPEAPGAVLEQGAHAVVAEAGRLGAGRAGSARKRGAGRGPAGTGRRRACRPRRARSRSSSSERDRSVAQARPPASRGRGRNRYAAAGRVEAVEAAVGARPTAGPARRTSSAYTPSWPRLSGFAGSCRKRAQVARPRVERAPGRRPWSPIQSAPSGVKVSVRSRLEAAAARRRPAPARSGRSRAPSARRRRPRSPSRGRRRASFGDRPDHVVGQRGRVGRVVLVGPEGEAVVAVEAVLGAEPHVAAAVLEHGEHGALREALLRARPARRPWAGSCAGADWLHPAPTRSTPATARAPRRAYLADPVAGQATDRTRAASRSGQQVAELVGRHRRREEEALELLALERVEQIHLLLRARRLPPPRAGGDGGPSRSSPR